MPEREGHAYRAERAQLLKAFGEQLRTLRKQRNLAQERLAEVASLHRNEIGVLERGQGEPGLLTLLIPRRRAGGPAERANGRGARSAGTQARETPQRRGLAPGGAGGSAAPGCR
jgi:transcriptional regulator with XRE-family HTH domain